MDKTLLYLLFFLMGVGLDVTGVFWTYYVSKLDWRASVWGFIFAMIQCVWVLTIASSLDWYASIPYGFGVAAGTGLAIEIQRRLKKNV